MKFFLTTIAALTLALALAPRAAARGQAGREKAIEKQAEEQRGGEGSPIERSTAAEKSVVVSVCVASGDVVVHGWDRAEVRARASEAGGLRLLTPPNVPSAPRVDVLVSDERDAEPSSGECGSAGTLELSVPRGASVNVKAQSGDVEVADVAGVRVTYERDLALLDSAIKETRRVAAENPKDKDAVGFLMSAYQSKVELLTKVADQAQVAALGR